MADDNGGVHYLPEQVVQGVLNSALDDYEIRQDLVNVCEEWRHEFRHHVWRQIKQRFGPLPGLNLENFIFSYEAYDRNLIKNHSGENNDLSHWQVSGPVNNWEIIQNPIVYGPAFPQTGLIDSCFGTFYPCGKMQTINLLNEGILPIVMDTLQPKINISEWIGSPPGVSFSYSLTVILANENLEIVKAYSYLHNEMVGGNWHKVDYTFQNYEPGVRLITFLHGGHQTSYRRRVNSCWMTRASVKVLFEFSRLNEIVDDGPKIIIQTNENVKMFPYLVCSSYEAINSI